MRGKKAEFSPASALLSRPRPIGRSNSKEVDYARFTAPAKPCREPGGPILSYDIETIAPPMPDDSFPPWPTHQPVAIGFAAAQRGARGWSFDIAAMVVTNGVEEADLLREADRRMGLAEVVTGYNSRQFDALVLRLAAQKRGSGR